MSWVLELLFQQLIIIETHIDHMNSSIKTSIEIYIDDYQLSERSVQLFQHFIIEQP